LVEISAQATATATAPAPAPATTAITMKPSVDRRRKGRFSETTLKVKDCYKYK
jgi:hypothetical protein